MNTWMIRGGDLDQFVDVSRRYDVAVLGFVGTPDFSSTESLSQLRQQVESAHPEKKSGVVTGYARQIANFVWDIEPGDQIVMPYQSGNRFVIGTAGKSRYWYEAGLIDEASHFKSVHWHNEISRDQLPPDLWGQMRNARSTVRPLKVANPGSLADVATVGASTSHSDAEGVVEATRKLTEVQLLKRDKRIVAEKWRQSLSEGNGPGRCEACDFTHPERGMFDIHHLRPVSQMEPGGKTRLKDLAVLCPRCHRMAHLGTGAHPHPIATLKRMLSGWPRGRR